MGGEIGQQRDKKRYLPAEAYAYLLFLFYDIYIYYCISMNQLAFCSGRAAPLISIQRRMTITFENENDIIIYALEKIISYARVNHFIFLAQSICWISSLIGLQQQLVIHIDDREEGSDIALREAIPQAIGKINQIVTCRRGKEVSVEPRDIQEDSRSYSESDYIDPDR
jgi:hypothetical protein